MVGHRIAASAIISALSVSTGSAAHAQVAGVEALLQQANYWEGRGQRSRAAELYRKVLAIDPSNPTALGALGGASEKILVNASAVSVAPTKAPTFASSTQAEVKAAPAKVVPADPAGDARAAGFRYLQADDLDAAKRKFEQTLGFAPDDSNALGGLGIVYLRKGQFEQARDFLSKASKGRDPARWADALASANFYTQVNAARSALELGDANGALSIAQNLPQMDQADAAIAYSLLADIYEKREQYGDALQASRAALQVSGIRAEFAVQIRANAIRQEALLASQMGKTSVAEKLFQQGLATSTEDPWIRYEYARFLRSQGRNWDVKLLLDKLAASSDPEHLYAAALLSEQQGLYDDASALVNRIPKSQLTAPMQSFLRDLTAQAALTRARLLDKQGKGAQAIAGLKQILATNSLPGARQAEIAGELFDLGDETSAITLAHSLLEAGLNDPAGYEPLVRILSSVGQTTFAYAAIQQAEERMTPSSAANEAVARMRRIVSVTQADRLREGGQYAQSYEVLQAAWAQSGGNVDILMSLARLYQAGGLTIPATQTFKLVLEQDQKNQSALMGLIDTAAAGRDFDLARDAFSQLERLDPDNYAVYLAGARMETLAGKENVARKYLERARELYTAGENTTSGGFTPDNPFAAMASAGALYRPATPEPVNPFDTQALKAQSQNPLSMVAGTSRLPFGDEAAFSAQGRAPYASPERSDVLAVGLPSDGRFVGADPVLASIADDLESLDEKTGPRLDVETRYRDRSGEAGLSSLSELSASAKYSTGLGDGRVFAGAHAVSVDAGESGENSLLKFGRDGLLKARGIVSESEAELPGPEAQQATGIALSTGYDGDLLQADIGTTPLGFERIQVQGSIGISPTIGEYSSTRLWLERRPVSDSVLSYAGTRDPVTNGFWGAVMRSGIGLSAAYEKGGTGFYLDSMYLDYAGVNVEENRSIEINGGGYLLARDTGQSTLTIGVNGNYQHFDSNQNVFTYGTGGYFSPQQFLSVSFPIRYGLKVDSWDAEASISPGYQSFGQDSEPFYPTDSAAQAELYSLAALNRDVQAVHDSSSETGFGINFGGSTYFTVAPGVSIGGEVKIDTFGVYNEFQTMFGIRRTFGVNP